MELHLLKSQKMTNLKHAKFALPSVLNSHEVKKVIFLLTLSLHLSLFNN